MSFGNLSFGSSNKPAGGTGSSTSGSGFGFGSSNSSTTGGGFGATTNQQQTAEKVELPPELNDKTVGSILDSYEDQLEKQAKQFLQRAEMIASRDRAIYECLGLMEHLENQIGEVENRQKALARDAEVLLREQDQVLRKLEERRKESSGTPQTADQRRRLYKLAHDLGERFLSMEARLKRLVEETEGQNDESESDVGKIVKIANYHLDSMKWIETQCQAIEEKVDKLSKTVGT